MIAELCQRVRLMPTVEEPWPYSVLDDFLPVAIFEELVTNLERLEWTQPIGRHRKSKGLPASVTNLLMSVELRKAFCERLGVKHNKIQLEAAWTGEAGLKAHVDRSDKTISAQVYLTGDPKGTELYDVDGKLAGEIEWKPNRLAAWTRPPKNQRHAAPKSSGRYVLLYWFLR